MSGEYIPAGQFAQSTTEDLAKYLMLYLNKGNYNGFQVLSTELIGKMWEGEIEFVGLSQKEGGSGQKYQYGLGWMISNIDGRKVIHHGGSTGTTSSFTMIDSDNEIAVSLISNVDLTLIDRHQYPFGLNIVNNIIHLANGNSTTKFSIPTGEDPTSNNFNLKPDQLHNYLGNYEFKW